MSLLAERLARKMKQDLGIDVEPVIHRTWASYFHDDDGANKWYMYEIVKGKETDYRSNMIGSGYPATECVKRKYKMEFGLSDLSGDQIELHEIN